MKVPAQEYLSSIGVDLKRAAKRYTYIFFKMNLFIEQYAFNEKVTVNCRMLAEAIHDYYVDTVRAKKFHGMEYTNAEKVYAYLAYWLLRRKPLQAIKEFNGCEFINELFITLALSSSIASEKNIPKDKKENNPTFKKFQDLLFYNLKYRPVSQQSLELMIEAFFSGCDFAGTV
jgi:hypothetical protein